MFGITRDEVGHSPGDTHKCGLDWSLGAVSGTGIVWLPVGLAREAFAPTFKGSRHNLEEVSVWRLQAALVLLLLATRCVHLAQAGIDVAAGNGAYTRPVLAEGLAVACVVESVVFGAVILGARRLTLGALLGDATFGIVGLAVMSAATSAAPGRAGSLNWMLPYTVTTAVGIGLLLAGDSQPPSDLGTMADVGGWMRRAWPTVLARAAVVGALAVAYIISVNLPRRLPGDPPVLLWANDANYLAFFASALVLSLLLRRWLMVIGQRNAEAIAQAAQLSHEAHWRAMTVDLFGPVLEMLDGLAVIQDQVPTSMREEAGRLISLIEAVNPLSGTSTAGGLGPESIRDDGH
jgi:hypothetical protein